MKKNFMAIASLLIAAMLLVVSCSQESVIPENNGLVEAKLSVGYGRGIKVDNVTDAKDLTVQFKMTPKWTDDESEPDTITNPASEFKKLPSNGNIGWVTPGYWMIEVKASKDNKDVFYGNVSCYFTKNSTSAVVYLAPVNGETNNCSIEITVSMQEIKETINSVETPYTLEYEIFSGTSTEVVRRGKMDISVPSTSTNKIVTYSNTKSELPAGFYTAIVYVVDARGNTVGGIRKGFLLTNGDAATLTGHIEPADYSNVTINAVYVDVKTVLTIEDSKFEYISGSDSDPDNDYYKYEYAGSPVQVTVNLQNNTTNLPSGVNAVPTSFWCAVSNNEEENTVVQQTANVQSKTFTFDAPGNKYITCTTVYEVTVPGVGSEAATKYYFADTQEAHIFIDPTTYNNGLIPVGQSE